MVKFEVKNLSWNKMILLSIQHITNTTKSKWELFHLTALINPYAGKAQQKGQTSS